MARSERHLIAHLLRRAGFGSNAADLDFYTSLGFVGSVDHLINYDRVDDSALEETISQMRANNPTYSNAERPEYGHPNLEVAIWLARMLLTKRPLQEKMTLYWHGHFTSSIQDVKFAPLMHRQNELFRSHALTRNFKELTRAVARDPAMLLYLDNNTNRKGSPNENWSRELMELFTLGIGNYTESDVKEAARAFTGWTLNRQREFVFNRNQHDNGSKTVLGVTGNHDGDDVINILFIQPAHPKFIARRLFRFFVYDDPDEATVNKFANIYVNSGFSINELVTQLLLSGEFRSDRAFFAIVKSPVELTIGALRALSARITDLKPWNQLGQPMKLMGQQIYAPANVGGWPGNRSWINSSTYFARADMARTLVSIDSNATVDPSEIASQAGLRTSEAAVDYFLELLLQSDVPTEYRDILLKFMGNIGNANAREKDALLRGVVRLIMSSPAYQMN